MPTYEYRCSSCEYHFEKFSLKISEQSSVECPKCGAQAERLISGGGGVLFRGSGFYSTDYRSESYKEAAKKETKGPEKKASAADDSPKGKTRESKKDST